MSQTDEFAWRVVTVYLQGTEIGKHLELLDHFSIAAKTRLRALATAYATGSADMDADAQVRMLAEMVTLLAARDALKLIRRDATATEDAVSAMERRAVRASHLATRRSPAKRNPARKRFSVTPEMREQLGIPEPDRCECGKLELVDKVAADAVVASRSPFTAVVASYACPRCGRWHTTSQARRA